MLADQRGKRNAALGKGAFLLDQAVVHILARLAQHERLGGTLTAAGDRRGRGLGLLGDALREALERLAGKR